MHLCVILCRWCLAERRTRVETLTNDNYVSGEISWSSDLNGVKPRERSAQMWRRQRNVHVLLHVRSFGDCSVSSCGGHTATVGTRARDTHEVWSSASVGCEPDSSTCARTRKRAEVKARPRPLVKVNRREDSQTRQDDTLGVHVC